MMWLHGGGWVVGDLDTADSACQWLCVHTGIVVVSVDYRLAPENPWPGPVEDSLRAWQALPELLVEHGVDGVPVGVGGDSAGGNLSAVLAHRQRGTDHAPAFQVLVYPSVDLRRQTDSFVRFADDLTLPRSTMDRCLELYAPEILHPDASPILAGPFEGLPPAVVATAGFDPLRDEGEAYVERLRAAGVPVHHISSPTLPHGYLHMDAMSAAAAEATDALTDAVRRVLGDVATS